MGKTSFLFMLSENGQKRAEKGRLENEELPAWTKKTVAQNWKQVSQDHDARNCSYAEHHFEKPRLVKARDRGRRRQRYDDF